MSPDNETAVTRRLDSRSRHPNSSSFIVHDIIRGLYEGRYVAGQRLAEPDLVALYAVSRSTVREALKQLDADGIVEIVPFRGAHIRKLSRTEAADLFSITEVVVGLVARQAAQRIKTAEARAKVQDLFRAIESYQDEEGRFEFLRHRNRYFRTLVTFSGNVEIHRILPRLQVHLIRNRLTVPAADRIDGYRRITAAVLSGDGPGAEDAARSHVRKTAACVLPHFAE